MYIVFVILFMIIICLHVLIIIRGDDTELRITFGVVEFIAILMLYGSLMGRVNSTPDFQYVPAEIVATNLTSTYFGTEDGNIYYIQKNPHWPDDVPYLLGMDTKGTQNVTDDEIVTVWRLYE